MTTQGQDDLIRALYPDPYVSIDEIVLRTKLTPAHIRVSAFRLGVKRGVSRENHRKAPRPPKGRSSLAERIAALLGEIPLPPAPRTEIPDADLLRYTGRADIP